MFTFLRRFLSFPDKSKTIYFHDRFKRQVIHHGVNISNYSKVSGPPKDGNASAGHPWHGDTEADNLKKWGFNLVRYLVHWESIEPKRGEYDEAYLARVVEDIDMYAEYGIAVIVDLHQDLFAQRYHGNGFPEWAVRDDGKSFKLQEPWALNYLQPAVRACFNNFWSNKDGLLDANISMVEHLYLKVKDLPNVLGIDVMNEPWPKGGPLTFERNELTDYYNALRKNVWLKHGKKGGQYFMFEPWMSTSAGYPTNLRPLEPYTDSYLGTVYMPHYYDFFCEQDKPYKWFNKMSMRRAFNIRCSEAQEFQSPLIFGEFGFPVGCKGYLEAMRDFLDLADEHQVGWAYWSYDKTTHNDRGFINPDGTPNPFLGELVRIYPQKIAGRNARYQFKGDVFTMTWEDYKTPCTEPTEVYVPEAWDVTVETEEVCTTTGATRSIFTTSGNKKHSIKITVKNRNGFPR